MQLMEVKRIWSPTRINTWTSTPLIFSSVDLIFDNIKLDVINYPDDNKQDIMSPISRKNNFSYQKKRRKTF